MEAMLPACTIRIPRDQTVAMRLGDSDPTRVVTSEPNCLEARELMAKEFSAPIHQKHSDPNHLPNSDPTQR